MTKVSLKVSFICISDTDIGIDFMIPILSDTFDMVYSPSYKPWKLYLPVDVIGMTVLPVNLELVVPLLCFDVSGRKKHLRYSPFDWG